MKVKKLKKKQIQILLKFSVFSLLIIFGYFIGVRFSKLSVFSGSLLSRNISKDNLINAKTLSDRLKNKNFVFVNVHTPYEGEITNTDIFIDYDSIIASKDKLPQDKNTEIILYCKSGKMSSEALKTLASLGYTNVKQLQGGMDEWQKEGNRLIDLSKLPDEVLPKDGFVLPIKWGDLGPKLVKLGVIDLAKFEKGINATDDQKKILELGTDENIKINSDNAQFIVDILWAAGLAQKSKVYEDGPMGKEYKAQLGNFASTGGWTLAKGDAVNYINKFDLVKLNPEQQNKVSEIAKNVYRPCCGNSTWFPDCNHGMAALAAIELMVNAGLPDREIYQNVLKLNSYWFSSSYLTTATYFARQGVGWDKVDAKEVLGQVYSSGQGANSIAQKVGPLPYESKSTGGCGV